MKKSEIIFIVSFFVLSIYLAGCYYNDGEEGRRENFKEQLGTYVLDIDKTDLGNYIRDSNIYKNLTITFNADSTFIMNMKVPFMRDSVGRWKAGNMKEWNWLFFKSFGYSKRMEDLTNPGGSQFTRPYTENSNIYFLINAATPQDNAEVISDIYFKRTTKRN